MTFRVCLASLVLVACATAGRDQPNPATDAPPGTVDAAPEIDAPPDANNCATQPCDILTQCGCGTDQACDIDNSDSMGTACRMVVAPGVETSTCTTASRCDRGFVCLFNQGQNVGTCKRYCDEDLDCGTPRGKCILEITSGGQPIAGIPKACSSNCDPTNAAAGGCPSGYKCGLFTAGTTNIVDCSIAGPGGQGANCKMGANGSDFLCAVDHLCTTVDGGTNFNCRRICNATTGTGCLGGTTCISFNEPFSVGGTEYGVCN